MVYQLFIFIPKGRIAEFDAPEALLKDPTSLFYSLAKDADII